MNSRYTYDCPISLQPMRHPVLASDGYFYEAQELSRCFEEHGLNSPLTRQPITAVTYARIFAELIDKAGVEERYAPYDVSPVLKTLNDRVRSVHGAELIPLLRSMPYSRVSKAALFAVGSYAGLSLLAWLILAVPVGDSAARYCQAHERYEDFAFNVATLLFVMDLALRYGSGDRLSMLGLFARTVPLPHANAGQVRDIELGLDFPNHL